MYTISKFKKGLTIKFSATFEGIDSVCMDIKQFISENGLEDICFNIILGVREVLTNAVQHGSKMDPHKEVFFSIEADERRILIRVTDSGSGFDWRKTEKKIPSPADTCGRGIGILGQNFDSYHYNEIGNEVELVKKINNGDCS